MSQDTGEGKRDEENEDLDLRRESTDGCIDASMPVGMDLIEVIAFVQEKLDDTIMQ